MESPAVQDANDTDDGKAKTFPLDDAGKPKGLPLRTCIATRQVKSIEEMIRFVAAPDGTLTPDLKSNLPGRGVWVSTDKASVLQALKTKAFGSALKKDVKVDPDLADQVGALFKERALQALSFANKAGEVICGATKIEKALGNKVLALLHASDGSKDGIEKLNRLYCSVLGPDTCVFAIFTNAELDMALGRSNVIHAALMKGHAAEACLQCINRITIYEREFF